MSQYNIGPNFECENSIWMSKYDIRPDFEFQKTKSEKQIANNEKRNKYE